MTPNDTFYEKQHFRQKWVFVLLLIVFCALAGGFVYMLAIGMKDSWVMLVAALFVLLLWLLFTRMILHVSLEADVLRFRLSPIQWMYKEIKKEDIRSVSLIKYRALSDYGGWGIRSNGKETAYIISGNDGINIELTNGKRLLVGTAHPETVALYLKEKWPEKFS